MPLSPNISTLKYSIHAAIKTINSPQVKLEIVYYSDRTGDSIGSQTLSAYPSGNMDWQVYDEELVIPETALYFNMKMFSYPPTNGASQVYWDDVGLIEWEEWNEFGNNMEDINPGGTTIKNPNDYYYLQVQTSTQLTNQEIAFVETFYGNRTDFIEDLNQNQCEELISGVIGQ